MNKKATVNNKETALLGVALAVCLIILAILIILIAQPPKSAPTSNTSTPQYVELPNVEGMNLAKAKALLDDLDISYEIIHVDSTSPNKVEKIEHSGTIENGKTLINCNETIKLYTNEVAKDKVVYLTFDDGPTRDNSNEIVFMLQDYGIKASFFVEGQDVVRYPDRMEAIFNRGHVIACHSYSHEYTSIYSSTQAFIGEIEQYEDALIEAIGEENFAQVQKIIRFPGGTNNAYLSKTEALAYIEAVRGLGYAVYDWTALTGDADPSLSDKSPKKLVSQLDSSLKSAKSQGLDLIILMHDNVYSKEALSEVLDYLIAEGYYFDTIDNCPEYTLVEN